MNNWIENARSEFFNGFEVVAASLSRLIRHMSVAPFAILSAEKADMSGREKKEALSALKNDIVSLGYGFIPTKGAWKEEFVNSQGDNIFQIVKENSLFVPNISQSEAVDLGNKYKQDAVLVGENGEWKVVNCEDGSVFTEDGEPVSGSLPETLKLPARKDIDSGDVDLFTDYKGKAFTLDIDDINNENMRSKIESIIRQHREELGKEAFVGTKTAKLILRTYQDPPPMIKKTLVTTADSDAVRKHLSSLAICLPFEVNLEKFLEKYS